MLPYHILFIILIPRIIGNGDIYFKKCEWHSQPMLSTLTSFLLPRKDFSFTELNGAGLILQAVHWNMRCLLTSSINLFKRSASDKWMWDVFLKKEVLCRYFIQLINIWEAGWRKSLTMKRWQMNWSTCFLSMLPATAFSSWGEHPPTGAFEKLHLGASKQQSVWRSMQSFTLTACVAQTCLGCSCPHNPPPSCKRTLPVVEWDELSILLKWCFLKGRQ